MQFLRNLFGKREIEPKIPVKKAELAVRIASEPETFARWVLDDSVLSISFEDDLAVSPSEEQVKAWGLQPSAVRNFANEYVIWRAVGVIKFLRNHKSERFYINARNILIAEIAERITRNAPPYALCKVEDVDAAIDEYWEALRSEGPIPFTMTYASRLLDGSNVDPLAFVNVAVKWGVRTVHETYERVVDRFCQLKTGFTADQLDSVTKAIERVEQTSQ